MRNRNYTCNHLFTGGMKNRIKENIEFQEQNENNSLKNDLNSKLELKHLAGYLPYGLKIETPYGIEILEALGDDWIFTEEKKAYHFTVKPILRPLSGLTKEIEVNGEKFVPIDKIAIYGSEYYLIEQIKTGMVEVIIWQMLLEWHFDIHGLIEKGLAIDINTLKQ